MRSSVENEATTLTEDPVSTEQSHQTQDEEEQMQVAPAAAEGHEEEEPLSGSSFELNDGGVPIPVPAEGADGVSNTTLKCPMCPVEFVVRIMNVHISIVSKVKCVNLECVVERRLSFH